AIQHDIWVIDLTQISPTNPVICKLGQLNLNAICRPVDTNGDDATPAWGAAGLIAYQRGTPAHVWTLNPDKTRSAFGYDATDRQYPGITPAWGGNLLAF